MSSLPINLTNVAKTYSGKVHALRGIAMQVHRGEIFGLLGPNGAGKSTLVKILMTVVSPTRCDGTILDHPVGHKATLARVGYLPEHHKFPDYLTGRQVLDFYAALAGVSRSDRRKRADELLELVGMKDWQHTRVRGYSKGMRQRIGVAQALMNDPDLVLLDEPTDGVDPVGRRDIRNILGELKRRGKTVLLNSHLLSELEMICDRVAILVQGQVSSQGTLDELTAADRRYEIEIAADEGPAIAFPDVLARLADWDAPTPPTSNAAPMRKGTLSGGVTIEANHTVLRINSDRAALIQPLIDALRAQGVVIRAVRPSRPSLEDLFMRAVTDPLTGGTFAPGAQRNARSPKAAPGAKP